MTDCSLDIKERALMCRKLAHDKKAINPRLLDMKGRSSIADYIIVCSGTSDRQVKAIAENIQKEMKKVGYYALGVEGHNEGKWILVDYGDIIIHIFYDELRHFYDIENLWPFAEEVSE